MTVQPRLSVLLIACVVLCAASTFIYVSTLQATGSSSPTHVSPHIAFMPGEHITEVRAPGILYSCTVDNEY